MPESGEVLPVGVHGAIGGPHDAPTPGDILCSALVACEVNRPGFTRGRLV